MTIEVSSAEIRKARLGVYFIAIIALIFVILFSVKVSKGVVGPISALNWVPMNATLLNVSIDEMTTTTTKDNRSQYTLYTPRILYKYTVSGQEYIGRKVTWSDIYDDGYMRELGYELKRKWAANVPIEIHVNLSNAAESIVVKNIIWEHMSKLLVGFIISWAVFLWLAYVLVFKLKHKK